MRRVETAHTWLDEEGPVVASSLDEDEYDEEDGDVCEVCGSGDGDDESRMRRGDGAVAEGLSRQSWLTS